MKVVQAGFLGLFFSNIAILSRQSDFYWPLGTKQGQTFTPYFCQSF
ncbi:hypothetical protein HMPREF6745_0975 [Prevotella sp. oral taxon 472 str. F0295]|nr:hypothetical protein HMPREF6745_0975 [Prevotella sp. oral taxon 472 str. F0295]